MRAKGVLAVAVRLGVAHQVEPVPRPSLAVSRRSQQAVDQPLVGIGRIVGVEGVDFLGVGGSPVRSKVTRRIKVVLSASGRVSDHA